MRPALVSAFVRACEAVKLVLDDERATDDEWREAFALVHQAVGQRDAEAAALLLPIDPTVVAADVGRLRGQNGQILAALAESPRTNAELSRISLKYTSRISDVRAAGYAITCTRGQGGIATYSLQGRYAARLELSPADLD